MSGSPTWNSWFSFPFFAPLSGAVNQDIDTGPYQGVPEIEIAIIREVGSFGKQLGIISDAVRDLAVKMGELSPESAEISVHAAETARTMSPLETLDDLVRRVKRVKDTYAAAVERDATQALERLHRVDPEKSRTLTARFQR